MDTITVVFTKTPRGILSFLVRWALPRSRFALALSSHCYIDIGDKWYEADLKAGVREVEKFATSKGEIIVKAITYGVPDIQAGLNFLKEQLGKKYDIKGALGVGIGPDRDWAEDDKWFCYELAAATLRACGRDVFNNISHITEIALFSIKP